MSRAQSIDLATFPARWLTVPQLAAAVECDERTIRRMIETGAIRAIRVGRCWRVPTENARAAFHDVPRGHTLDTSHSI